SAPSKVLVALVLHRGQNVDEAMAILNLIHRGAPRVVEQVFKSAIAKAEQNYGVDTGNIYVSEAFVDEGATMKRFRPRAQGRASKINKRTRHITLVVSEQKEG